MTCNSICAATATPYCVAPSSWSGWTGSYNAMLPACQASSAQCLAVFAPDFFMTDNTAPTMIFDGNVASSPSTSADSNWGIVNPAQTCATAWTSATYSASNSLATNLGPLTAAYMVCPCSATATVAPPPLCAPCRRPAPCSGRGTHAAATNERQRPPNCSRSQAAASDAAAGVRAA